MEYAVKIIVSEIPDIELRVLCAAFLDAATKFYENEENKKAFERWLAEKKGGVVDGQKDGGKAAPGVSEPSAG